MQSDGTFDFVLRELGGFVSESIYQFLTAETTPIGPEHPFEQQQLHPCLQ